MPAYHSELNASTDYKAIGNMDLLPIKTKTRGPAPMADAGTEDIVDEALDLFRANCFFRNFEIKGNADRVLIYLILFISDCLSRIAAKRPEPSQAETLKLLNAAALDSFALPGDPSFPLNGLYTPPRDRVEAEQLKNYLSQARQEIGIRLTEVLYKDGPKPSKWWMSFQKRKFMNKSL